MSDDKTTLNNAKNDKTLIIAIGDVVKINIDTGYKGHFLRLHENLDIVIGDLIEEEKQLYFEISEYSKLGESLIGKTIDDTFEYNIGDSLVDISVKGIKKRNANIKKKIKTPERRRT